MSKKSTLMFAYCVLLSTFSFNVQAFPILSPPEVVAGRYVELVRDFCGRRFHRDPSGHCIRNGSPYLYSPPVRAAARSGRADRVSVRLPSLSIRPLLSPHVHVRLLPWSIRPMFSVLAGHHVTASVA
jgi:hypothetical protein